MTPPHGGKRPGAGRPKGQGRYGETSKPMRIPLSKVSDVQRLIQTGKTAIPLFSARVPAGFPSPADDYIESYLDLNNHLIQHPAATFMVRASGDSMIGAGIHSGDILIVDRSLEARDGKVVIAAIDGELTVKRLKQQKGQMILAAENKAYPPIIINEMQDSLIWGVVKHVIHSF